MPLPSGACISTSASSALMAMQWMLPCLPLFQPSRTLNCQRLPTIQIRNKCAARPAEPPCILNMSLSHLRFPSLRTSICSAIPLLLNLPSPLRTPQSLSCSIRQPCPNLPKRNQPSLTSISQVVSRPPARIRPLAQPTSTSCSFASTARTLEPNSWLLYYTMLNSNLHDLVSSPTLPAHSTATSCNCIELSHNFVSIPHGYITCLIARKDP